MPGYALHCTLCGDSFDTRRDWLSHLLWRQHQDLARREVWSWDEEIKEQVIVAFSAVPVGCLEFLEHFSKGSFIASDFVFWEGRPRLGFVFLESRDKVTEMLEFGSEVRVNGQIVHLKRASDYLRSELDHLLPQETCRREIAVIKVEIPDRLEDSFGDKEPTSPNLGNLEVSRPQSPVPVSVKAEFNGESNSMDVDDSDCDHSFEQEEDNPDPEFMKCVSVSDDNNINQSVPQLVKDYLKVSEAMQISDQEYSTALNVVKKFERVFTQKFPFCKLYMFRHKYTKIEYFQQDEFLVYVDCEGRLTQGVLTPEPTTKEIFNIYNMRKTFKSPLGQSLLPSIMFVPVEKQQKLLKRGSEACGRLFKIKKVPKPLELVRLVTDTRFLVEAQTCRLLKYLCKFDTRAWPLLMLVGYWAQNEEIPFFKRTKVTSEEPSRTWRISPGPGAVEWLVMLFLSSKKMVPSPREVLGWPHNLVMIFKGPDIGFSDDDNYVNEWKRDKPGRAQIPKANTVEFVLDLIRLVKEFFEFYGELQSGEWILNPRDGEVINKSEFLSECFSGSKLAQQEVDYIKGISFEKTGIDIRGWKVVFLNPLHIARCFSFDGDKFTTQVCPIMKEMACVLSQYQQKYTHSKIRLESLFSYNCEDYLQFKLQYGTTNNVNNIHLTEMHYVEIEEEQDNQMRPGDQSRDRDIPLVTAYESMCSIVELPEDEYKSKLDFVAALEKMLTQCVPSCKLYMFRYFYLGLQDFTKNDEFLIFMDHEGKIEQGGKWSEMEKFLQLNNIRPKYPADELLKMMNLSGAQIAPDADKQKSKCEKYGRQFILNGLAFSLVPDARFIVETQTCRLLQHMCSYNVKARPLLILIKFWATCNKIELSPRNKDTKTESQSYDFPPEGTALEWLAMLFLCHKKLVPTPRQLQSRQHANIMVSGTIDVGFSHERNSIPEEPEEVSQHFILELFTLAKEFFQFFTQLRTDSWIIYTRDAEMVKSSIFFSKKAKKNKEVFRISQIKAKSGVLVHGWPIVMLQPLHYLKCFPIASASFQEFVVPLMQDTAENLGHFLQHYSRGDEVDFKTLLTLSRSLLKRRFREVSLSQKKIAMNRKIKKAARETLRLKRVKAAKLKGQKKKMSKIPKVKKAKI